MSTGKANLSITGTPSETTTLNVAGPLVPTKTAPLFMAAPPHFLGTLVIGKDQLASGDASLVILGDIISGTDPALQKVASAFVKGTSASPLDQTFNLVLRSEPFASGVNEATLFLRQDGTVPQENLEATVFVSGDITSVGGDANNAATLQIENREGQAQALTLYIDKDFNNSSEASLFVKNTSANNNITAALSGAFVDTQTATLTIKPPTSGNLNLFTRGYLE